MAPRLPFMRRRNTETVPVAKVAAPPAIDAAFDAQGMNSSTAMGPGRPMNPARGWSLQPRSMDYRPGINLNSGRNRAAWGRTSFDTLKAVIDCYDVARACIDHKISELQSMEPLFQPADGFSGDTETAIAAARLALEFPDRDLPYLAWLSKWLEDCFRYDAGTLYRRRNLAGEVIGLEVIDGKTVFPHVDGHGRKPQPPATAFYQVIQGRDDLELTTDDIIPTLFRPQPDSPFGLAPIESVLLTANTDLRFQTHFLELFTEGNIPAGFVELPGDISSPDQVAEWQDYWDALMVGDQAMLRRLRAVPMGTKVTETRPSTFDTTFAEYLASRTASAFGVLPQDLGLNHDINRANGETQTDIQFRVNTLPWVRFVEGVLSRYLRYDLGLPVKVSLDTGRDVVDRVAESQAWDVAVKGGAVSVDEWRQEVYGLPIDNERPAPRFIFTQHAGPIPLRSLYAVAGPTDSETGAPTDLVPLDTTPFAGAPGVLPDKLPGGPQFARALADPDDPAHPALEHVQPGTDTAGLVVKPQPVTKEATAGVTAATGITGVDLDGDEEDDDTIVDLSASAVAKAAELASFRRFTKARAKAGKWRDFQFTSIDPLAAAELNAQARESLLPKAASPVAKSWRDGAGSQPQHEVDLKLVDFYAPKVADALTALVTDAQIRAAIEAASTLVAKASGEAHNLITQAVAAQLSGHVDITALDQVLRQMIADGYLAGGAAARQQLGDGSVTMDGATGQAVAAIDWSRWEPGDVDAAIRAADGGLATLLDDASIGIKDVVGTSLDTLGNRIADGLLSGLNTDSIAASLSDWVTGARAELVAVTETARAVTTATLDTYQANDVAMFDWVLSAGACPRCVDLAAGGPYPATDTDNAPPGHPRCRCAASPHIDG